MEIKVFSMVEECLQVILSIIADVETGPILFKRIFLQFSPNIKLEITYTG